MIENPASVTNPGISCLMRTTSCPSRLPDGDHTTAASHNNEAGGDAVAALSVVSDFKIFRGHQVGSHCFYGSQTAAASNGHTRFCSDE